MVKILSEQPVTASRIPQQQGEIFRKRANNGLPERRDRRVNFVPSLVQILLLAAVVLNIVSFNLFRCFGSSTQAKEPCGCSSDDKKSPEHKAAAPKLRSNFLQSPNSSETILSNAATSAEPESSFEDNDDDSVTSDASESETTKLTSRQRPHSTPSPNEESMPPITQWTVIVSTNAGFEHVFLNWYRSFIKVGLDKDLPLILIADDEDIYKKYQNSTKMIVKKGWEASDKFTDPTLTGDYKYGSRAYKKLVSRRPALILDELERGTDVLYIDIDTVLRGDPRPFFKGNYDFWGQKHRFLKTGDDHGRPTFCTGFLALRSTENTKALVRDWRDRLESGKGGLNQGAFNKAVYNCEAKDSLRAMALSEGLFPTGNRYKKFSQEQRDMVVLMHNNYCRGGDCKQTRMEEYGLWDPARAEDLM